MERCWMNVALAFSQRKARNVKYPTYIFILELQMYIWGNAFAFLHD